jgi:hypothetical protein
MLLVAAGRGAEARRLLEETSERFRESAALTNNLANIRLATGDAADAIELYGRALTRSKDPKTQIRVHLNTAIAADANGKTDLYLKHTTHALSKARTPELRTIVTDFLAGLGDGGIVPGVEGGAFDRVAFAARLRQALEAHGSTVRGNAAPTVRVSAADLVYWLEEVAK